MEEATAKWTGPIKTPESRRCGCSCRAEVEDGVPSPLALGLTYFVHVP